MGPGQPGRNGPEEAGVGESAVGSNQQAGTFIRGCFSGVWQGSKEGLVRNLSCVEEEAGSGQLPEGVVGWFISLLGPP